MRFIYILVVVSMMIFEVVTYTEIPCNELDTEVRNDINSDGL